MDLVELASFDVIQRWIDRMFEMYNQQPAPGFQKVTQGQLLRADRQAFQRLSELCHGSLKAVDGVRPLDAHIQTLATDVTVTYFMLPAPSHSQSAAKTSDKDHSEKDKASSSSGNKRPASSMKDNAQTKAPTPRARNKGAGKFRDPIPQALKGMHSRTPQGKPICFSWNLGKCAKGDACPRDLVCCVPGCYKNHPQAEHQRQERPRVSLDSAKDSSSKKRKQAVMANDSQFQGCRKMPSAELDSFYAIELFCGSGNLTIAMKHFYPAVVELIARRKVVNLRLFHLTCQLLQHSVWLRIGVHHLKAFGYTLECLVGQLRVQD